MVNRPGIMIRGKVVMAPGRIDSPASQRFLPGVRVMVNGVYCNQVIGYDEKAREAVVSSINGLTFLNDVKVEAHPVR